jgi:hypothetical protein
METGHEAMITDKTLMEATAPTCGHCCEDSRQRGAVFGERCNPMAAPPLKSLGFSRHLAG